MFRSSTMLAASLVIAGAAQAAAQTPAGVPPAPGRLTVSVNVGFQGGDHDITRSMVFPLYDEEGRIDITQPDIGGGGLFEFGGTYRITDQFGAGLAFTFNGSEGDGAVEGTIPHPQVFDQFRPLSAVASGLEHKERGVHLQATWHLPFTEALDFTVSAGPSFFNISQDFIRRVAFSEIPPTFDAVNVDEVELLSLRKNAVGFNLGVDASYTITPMIGVGVLARYTRGGADFDLNDNDSARVKAGGFQMAAGVRVRLGLRWPPFPSVQPE